MFCFSKIYLHEIRRNERAVAFPWELSVGIAYMILSLLLLPWRQSRERALLTAFHSDNIQSHPSLHFASYMACTVQQVNFRTVPFLSWSCTLFGEFRRVCGAWSPLQKSLLTAPEAVGVRVPFSFGTNDLSGSARMCSHLMIPASFQALHPQKAWNNSLSVLPTTTNLEWYRSAL